jgi:hypothetical protein
VREDPASYGIYDVERSELCARGSVAVSKDARWMAMLTVPIPDNSVVFVQLERQGPLPEGYRGSEEAACLSVPLSELGALVTLLAGVMAHARHDGVLPRFG